MFDDVGIILYIIVGNYDFYYKNVMYLNVFIEFLVKYFNVKVYDKFIIVDFDGCLIDLIFWMCEENIGEIFEYIKILFVFFCVGYWELNGFYFYKGMKFYGFELDFFKIYKEVWFGYFYIIFEVVNVRYIGILWILIVGDENDFCGFWMFDIEIE